jgi:hypothetical protein
LQLVAPDVQNHAAKARFSPNTLSDFFFHAGLHARHAMRRATRADDTVYSGSRLSPGDFWQFPHFMAIAWMYREDYGRAGYEVLPQGRNRRRFVAWQTVIPALLLVLVSLIPAFLGDEERIYFLGAAVLGLAFFFCAARLAFNRSNVIARRLLLASIIYLPSVFLLMLLDRK